MIRAEGPIAIYSSMKDIEETIGGDDGYIIIIEGESLKITITPPGPRSRESTREIISTKHPRMDEEDESWRIAEKNVGTINIVLDQMFKGFSEILSRELPNNVHIHEVLGKGIDEPIRAGRVTKWPAHDDYDVFKIVEELSEESGKVIFFTGDKRLARQTASTGKRNLIVEYLPPNEFPGKESLVKKIISSTLKVLED